MEIAARGDRIGRESDLALDQLQLQHGDGL